MAYQDLPNFIRECNQAWGWTEANCFHGHTLDTDDFLTAIELLLKYEAFGKWITKEILKDMQQLALEAKAKNSLLKIVRS